MIWRNIFLVRVFYHTLEITEFYCHLPRFFAKIPSNQRYFTMNWFDGKNLHGSDFLDFPHCGSIRNNLVSLWQNFVKSTDLITRLLWIIGNLISRNFLFESVQSHYHITPVHNRSSNSFSQFLLTVHRSLRMKFMATSGHPLGKKSLTREWLCSNFVVLSFS